MKFKRVYSMLLLLAVAVYLWGQQAYELPAGLADRPELVLRHTGFTLSYNSGHGTANWSAWMLTRGHAAGSQERSGRFYRDELLPQEWAVLPQDYARSGFDRGHLCPAADNAWSAQAMHDCFLMSNMCPQVPELNRVSWKELETACREWVQKEDTLYIVCGPVYRGAEHRWIGKVHRVDVPEGFFKAVLSLRKGYEKAIGFYYANTAERQRLPQAVTTVDALEVLTGMDFFCQLPDSLEDRLEAQSDLQAWEKRKR